ncbi:MAG: DUF2953 domain-containing protein, partial [Moorella sp. (in: Bacteria)]|nr:DUF2953 domain-containing protein [Moorella sp. (in: firmicutes)]
WWYKLKSVAGIWQHFFARITCKRCRLFFALGAKDPAAAALLYGSTWSLLAWMYQNLRRRTRLDFNNLEWRVAPHFDIPGWQVDFNCIFTFRAGHIISAGMQSLVLLLQTVWQLRRSGPVARTPHRSFDEDRHGKHQGYG